MDYWKFAFYHYHNLSAPCSVSPTTLRISGARHCSIPAESLTMRTLHTLVIPNHRSREPRRGCTATRRVSPGMWWPIAKCSNPQEPQPQFMANGEFRPHEYRQDIFLAAVCSRLSDDRPQAAWLYFTPNPIHLPLVSGLSRGPGLHA